MVRLLRPRVGLTGDQDASDDLVGVSTQAASDLPGESFQAASDLFGEASSDPKLLSEASTYLGLLLRALVLRRILVGVSEFLALTDGLWLFLVVGLAGSGLLSV